MVDAIVSVVLEQLSSILADKVHEEVKLVVGVKKELQKLQSNLKAIHAVLADAEEKQLKEKLVEQWLDKLKDVAYDMEDVLDEWNTALLKLQIEGRDSHDSASTTSKRRRPLSLFSSSCFCCKEVGLRRDIAKNVKELNETLNDVTNEKDRFNFEVGKGKSQHPEPQTTSSFIDTKEVRSRKEEKEMLKQLLLSESSQSSTMNIISIVGIGGIGKTTLAQLLFNDDDVKAHFNQNIWVCVSKPFDSTRVARAILESLSGDAQRFGELEVIMTRIKEAIAGKRFLLVLDDVWQDGPENWDKLKPSLLGGLPGSRILVTTRSERVAGDMGCTNNNLCRVGKLSLDECWSILRQIAFYDKENEECQLFEPAGKGIVKKCDGLPLAAKVLGGILRWKSSLQEWEDVLNSELWELPGIWEGQTGLASLWLSYYDLSSEMRQCFSYCAIFPEDHTIKKSQLIAMWMAQGYLGTSSRMKNVMEKCGEEHFQSLSRRCFFQQFDNPILHYKMHDVLRDFAQYLKGEECFSMEINKSEELTELPTLSPKTRHLRIRLRTEASVPSSIFKLEKLRTFWLQPYGNTIIDTTTLSSLFDKLICLRLLILSGCGIIGEIPASIGKLVHLRQLDLSYNPLRKLHENVCELYNLQTLDVSYCGNLDLPKRMEKLINLRHLDNLDCGSPIPRGVLKLSKLRRLGQLVIDRGPNEGNFSIADLKNFKNLEGQLWIKNLRNVGVEEAKEAQLNKMNQITFLGLSFGDSEEREEMTRHHEQVIEALWPSPSVEILHIVGFKGIKLFPNWLMLNNLKHLRLYKCKNCEHLPPLWKLPMLEELELLVMEGVKRLGEGFVGMESGKNVGNEVSESSSMVATMAFPKLKILEFESMKEWEEWESVEVCSNFTIMPCLSNLRLVECPKLNAFPNYIYQSETLEKVNLGRCPMIEKLCKEEENRGQKKWNNSNLNIHYYPECNLM